MMEKKEEVWVTLREIREEIRYEKENGTGKRIKKAAYFSSMQALLRGAFRFVEYFEQLHREGRVYESDDPGAFLFCLSTGEMRYQKQEKTSLQIHEFLAPELVEIFGREKREDALFFTVETDRYFMAVFLFEYFFHADSPFEGKKMVNRCFLSPLEKELFRAREGQFCMEIGENDNTPVKGIQDKLLHYWREYPELLKRMFQRAFMDGGILCELRPTEADWKQMLVRLGMDYQTCDCGFQGFSHCLIPRENGTFVCPICQKTYYVLSNGADRILLAQGVRLYECQTGRNVFDMDTVTAQVVENRQKKRLYGIKNKSKGIWRGLFPDGTVREIREGQAIPIWNGMMVYFEVGEEWRLRLAQTPDPDCQGTA